MASTSTSSVRSFHTRSADSSHTTTSTVRLFFVVVVVSVSECGCLFCVCCRHRPQAAAPVLGSRLQGRRADPQGVPLCVSLPHFLASHSLSLICAFRLQDPLGGGVAYLDKFCAHKNSQSEGVGAAIWQRIVADHPSLVWRSRIDNVTSLSISLFTSASLACGSLACGSFLRRVLCSQ